MGQPPYNGDGILADILEPHELEIAVALAVYTLGLVLADDDVPQRGAGMEEENGVIRVALVLIIASAGTAVILGPATVEDLARGNLDDLAVGDVLRRSRYSTLVAQAGEGRRQANNKLREAEGHS